MKTLPMFLGFGTAWLLASSLAAAQPPGGDERDAPRRPPSDRDRERGRFGPPEGFDRPGDFARTRQSDDRPAGRDRRTPGDDSRAGDRRGGPPSRGQGGFGFGPGPGFSGIARGRGGPPNWGPGAGMAGAGAFFGGRDRGDRDNRDRPPFGRRPPPGGGFAWGGRYQVDGPRTGFRGGWTADRRGWPDRGEWNRSPRPRGRGFDSSGPSASGPFGRGGPRWGGRREPTRFDRGGPVWGRRHAPPWAGPRHARWRGHGGPRWHERGAPPRAGQRRFHDQGREGPERFGPPRNRPGR